MKANGSPLVLSNMGQIMSRRIKMKNCLMRVDADEKIGFGHLMRCLALAEGLKEKNCESFFFMQLSTPKTRQIIEDRGFKVLKKLQSVKKLVLDHSIGLMIADVSHRATLANPSELSNLIAKVRELGVLTIVFDGLVADCISRKTNLKADVVVIPYCGADRLEFKNHKTTRFLSGEEYFIFRPEFVNNRKKSDGKNIRNVLISMGGADPSDLTVRAIDALKPLGSQGITTTIIVGSSFRSDLKKKIGQMAQARPERFKVLSGTFNMAELLEASDLLITSSGLTKYEAACVGVPTIVLPQANYQAMPGGFEERELAVIASEKQMSSTEQLSNLFRNVFANPELRSELSERGQKAFDGKGLERFLKKGVGL